MPLRAGDVSVSGRLLSEPFVAIFPSLVRSLGSMEAAAVVQYVAFRQPTTGEPVEIRVAEVAAATGLSESSVKRHTRTLAERGVLTKDQPGRNAAVRYAVVRDHPLISGEVTATPSGGQPDPLTPSIEKEPQEPPPQASGERPILALVASGADDSEPALFASPAVVKREVLTADESLNECRQAWLVAWTTAHGAPDPSIKRRAFGGIRLLAKDRTDADSWRSLWRACQAAGTAGRWDVSGQLAPAPAPRYRSANAHVAQADAAATAGLLDDLLARPAIGGTA